MNESIALYRERPGLLHGLNPVTKLAAALTLLAAAFLAPYAVAPYAVFLAVIVPLALAGGVGGVFLKTVFFLYLPFAFFLFLIHGLFHPSSGQELFHIWIFSVQPEALAFAAGVAGRALVMFSVFVLLFLTTHPGRLMQALQKRGMHWSVAYVIPSALQILPLVRDRMRTIQEAQKARGLSTGGSLFARMRAILPLLGPLFHGVILDVEDRALALESRAVMRKGPRDFLVEIPDPRWERIFRRCCLLAVAGMAAARGVMAWPW